MALIRAHGLLQPLVVRPVEDKPKHYLVIAGNRRLVALREVHRGDGDPRIPCVLREVDAAAADALSLGENFGREAMHPLDEAEAFAKLASGEGKGAEAIAAEFGVTEHYVRQRMKLAELAEPVKQAYREGRIDTGTAEAFAAVPEDRQLEVWTEVSGNPRHADHVRNVIANGWIDAGHALFDVATLPPQAVSRDLFSERVLVERKAFFEAQSETLAVQRQALVEDGWAEVVVGRRDDVRDRLLSMDTPEREYDEETSKKLQRVVARREKLEAKATEIGEDDEAAHDTLQAKYEVLEAEERDIIKDAPLHVTESTKAVATVFLILDPDGRVDRQHRVPRRRHTPAAADGSASAGVSSPRIGQPAPPTSEDLSDRQLAVTFTHQALAVREALLKNAAARRRVLALILHEKVGSEALAVRPDANGTTLRAGQGDGFASPAFERLRDRRRKLDPFADEHFVEDGSADARLAELSGAKLDALIDLLVVECVTAHMHRPTELVARLAQELTVNVRDDWRPDAAWLSSYQKVQLAHLTTELRGPIHAPPPERKKSELVEALATLFADAADGKLADKKLAQTVNRWLPANLRDGAVASS